MTVSPPSLQFTATVSAAENAVLFVAQCITIPLVWHLLWLAHSPFRRRQPAASSPSGSSAVSLSPSMTIYLATHALLAPLGMPMYAYSILYWRPGSKPAELYFPAVIYWLDMPSVLYVFVVSLAVFFLIADRCVVLAIPTAQRLYRAIQKVLAAVSILSIIGVFAGSAAYMVQVDTLSACRALRRCSRTRRNACTYRV